MAKKTWIYAKSVPKKLYVACSGGVDSVAAAAILSEWRDVTLAHFSHWDHASEQELETVSALAHKLNLPLVAGYQESQSKGNAEANWRAARYTWFHSLDAPVATGHTLTDAVEWYLMTCLRGRGEFMPVQNKNVFRPFLFTNKTELVEYAQAKGLEWWDDPTNNDPDFALRNRIRSQLLPQATSCEPGLVNMVRRRIVEKTKKEVEITS